MTKIFTIACAATLAAATFVSAEELTAPVAVTQTTEAYGEGLTSASTLTAAAIVIGGAWIVDNADQDGDDASSTGTTN